MSEGTVLKGLRNGMSALSKIVDGEIILLGVGGSHAYGSAHENSDVDVRGIYAAPINDLISLNHVQQTYELKNPDCAIHELSKLVNLCMNANPNAIEILYLPKPLITHSAVLPILQNRDKFLSSFIRLTYGGFAREQLKKVEKGVTSGELQEETRVKHLFHCFRVLEQGVEILQNGTVDLTIPNAEELWEIAKQDDEAIQEEFKIRVKELDSVKTDLPDYPDYKFMNNLILQVRWDLHNG